MTVKESSEWKLKLPIFQPICQKWGNLDLDLYASQMCNQVAAYMSWKLDSFSKGRDETQISWTHLKGYHFPLFSLIGRMASTIIVSEIITNICKKIFKKNFFHEGYDYNTTAGYKSTISAYHEPNDRFTAGEHPRFSTLLSGIFNNRPAQPKLNFDGVSRMY